MRCFTIDLSTRGGIEDGFAIQYPALKLHLGEGRGCYAQLPLGQDFRAELSMLARSAQNPKGIVPWGTQLRLNRAALLNEEGLWLAAQSPEEDARDRRLLLLLRTGGQQVRYLHSGLVEPLYVDQVVGDGDDRLFIFSFPRPPRVPQIRMALKQAIDPVHPDIREEELVCHWQTRPGGRTELICEFRASDEPLSERMFPERPHVAVLPPREPVSPAPGERVLYDWTVQGTGVFGRCGDSALLLPHVRRVGPQRVEADGQIYVLAEEPST